jgi:hypothetical protein
VPSSFVIESERKRISEMKSRHVILSLALGLVMTQVEAGRGNRPAPQLPLVEEGIRRPIEHLSKSIVIGRTNLVYHIT